MTFEATVRRTDAIVVLDLEGDIDRSAEDGIEEAFASAAEDAAAVLLNFADVDYINSSGIAVIVGLLAQARRRGIDVRACGLTDHYREIFEITRLADFVRIFPDETTAAAAVS